MINPELKTFAEWACIASKNNGGFTSDQLESVGGQYSIAGWIFPDGSRGKYDWHTLKFVVIDD